MAFLLVNYLKGVCITISNNPILEIETENIELLLLQKVLFSWSIRVHFIPVMKV